MLGNHAETTEQLEEHHGPASVSAPFNPLTLAQGSRHYIRSYHRYLWSYTPVFSMRSAATG